MITNQQVKTALDECIETRWRPATKNGGPLPLWAPGCQLCVLFIIDTNLGCEACPLKLHTRLDCCHEKANYSKWIQMDTFRPSPALQRRAQAVLDDLIGAREQFFGDWK